MLSPVTIFSQHRGCCRQGSQQGNNKKVQHIRRNAYLYKETKTQPLGRVQNYLARGKGEKNKREREREHLRKLKAINYNRKSSVTLTIVNNIYALFSFDFTTLVSLLPRSYSLTGKAWTGLNQDLTNWSHQWLCVCVPSQLVAPMIKCNWQQRQQPVLEPVKNDDDQALSIIWTIIANLEPPSHLQISNPGRERERHTLTRHRSLPFIQLSFSRRHLIETL